MTSLLKKLVMTTAVFAAPMLAATQALAEGERYVLVSHAPDSDSWWNTVRNGIKLAGDQMGVTVEYTNPPSGDIADMARLRPSLMASLQRLPILTC
jgi:simple sugar transport system substrate-binding protein